jgi:ketosteroid isomerase-like protein
MLGTVPLDGRSAVQNRSTRVDLDGLLQQLDAANTRMLDGDWSLWRQLISHREDVTVLGAYGSHVKGWEAVSGRFDRTAATYGGGGQSSHEHISSWIGADLACSVDLERHETRLEGNPDVVTFFYRVTHLFRPEEDGWKIVLRHADPLATFGGPQVAHSRALLRGE